MLETVIMLLNAVFDKHGKKFLLALPLIVLVTILSDQELWRHYFIRKSPDPASQRDSCISINVVQDNRQYFLGNNGTNYAGQYNDNVNHHKFNPYIMAYTIEDDSNALRNYLQYRARAYEQALRQICENELTVNLNTDQVSLLNSIAYRQNKEAVIAAPLGKIFAQLFDSVTYNCSMRQFECKLGVGYSLQARDYLPDDMTGLVMEALRKQENYRLFDGDPLNHPIDLGKILFAMENDTEFKRRYRNMLLKHEDVLSVLQIRTPAGTSAPGKDSSIFFDSGDFRLNPVMLIIIESVLERYNGYIKNYPQRQFYILVEGFADGTPINPGGIAYGRMGRWDPGGDTLRFIEHDGRLIGDLIERSGQGNLKLAYARAFEGLRQFQAVAEMTHPEFLQRVKLLYKGAANTTSTRPNAYERRVSFTIQKLN